MANALHRFTLHYVESMDTNMLSPEVWVINPDLSEVLGLDQKFWVIEGDSIRGMTTEEKNKKLLAQAKIDKNNEISDCRMFVFYAGFWWDGHAYELNAQSQSNIIATVAFIMTGVPLPPGFTWRTADDVSVPHTGQSFLMMYLNAIAWINMLYAISWEQKKYINSLKDYDTVVAFDPQPAYPLIVIGYYPTHNIEIAIGPTANAEYSFTVNE
jgi:hypothetical protein